MCVCSLFEKTTKPSKNVKVMFFWDFEIVKNSAVITVIVIDLRTTLNQIRCPLRIY